MIRVNLIGASKRKAAKAASSVAMPTSATPFILALIVIATGIGGYWWYSSTSKTSADLDTKIASAQAQKAALDAVIKQNQVYETTKKALEERIKAIDSLRRNQVSPVMAMDYLGQAVERTNYVWLSQLEQNNAILSVAGTGTSLIAVTDFLTNLKNTRRFRNIEPGNIVEAAGNFNFSLKCEFSAEEVPLVPGAPVLPAPIGGAHGN